MLASTFEALFRRERARFAAHFPRLAATRLAYIAGPCTLPGWCAARDFAYARPAEDPPVLVVNTRAWHLPYDNAVALVRHELGHLADPDPYVPGAGHEQRADDIAEYVGGARIAYDARDVQTIGPGRYPRPLHLHA